MRGVTQHVLVRWNAFFLLFLLLLLFQLTNAWITSGSSLRFKLFQRTNPFQRNHYNVIFERFTFVQLIAEACGQIRWVFDVLKLRLQQKQLHLTYLKVFIFHVLIISNPILWVLTSNYFRCFAYTPGNISEILSVQNQCITKTKFDWKIFFIIIKKYWVYLNICLYLIGYFIHLIKNWIIWFISLVGFRVHFINVNELESFMVCLFLNEQAVKTWLYMNKCFEKSPSLITWRWWFIGNLELLFSVCRWTGAVFLLLAMIQNSSQQTTILSIWSLLTW